MKLYEVIILLLLYAITVFAAFSLGVQMDTPQCGKELICIERPHK